MALLKDQDENSAAMKLIKIIKVVVWINMSGNDPPSTSKKYTAPAGHGTCEVWGWVGTEPARY